MSTEKPRRPCDVYSEHHFIRNLLATVIGGIRLLRMYPRAFAVFRRGIAMMVMVNGNIDVGVQLCIVSLCPTIDRKSQIDPISPVIGNCVARSEMIVGVNIPLPRRVKSQESYLLESSSPVETQTLSWAKAQTAPSAMIRVVATIWTRNVIFPIMPSLSIASSEMTEVEPKSGKKSEEKKRCSKVVKTPRGTDSNLRYEVRPGLDFDHSSLKRHPDFCSSWWTCGQSTWALSPVAHPRTQWNIATSIPWQTKPIMFLRLIHSHAFTIRGVCTVVTHVASRTGRLFIMPGQHTMTLALLQLLNGTARLPYKIHALQAVADQNRMDQTSYIFSDGLLKFSVFDEIIGTAFVSPDTGSEATWSQKIIALPLRATFKLSW